jgi:hypothetical protein
MTTLDSFSHWIHSMGRHAADEMDEALGRSSAAKPPLRCSGASTFLQVLQVKSEPTSGLEPLT